MSREACPTPETERAECPYVNRPNGCFSDTDHTYWPASKYRDTLGSTFRELPINKVQRCRWEHDNRHATEEPPERPSRAEMLSVIAQYVMSLESN